MGRSIISIKNIAAFFSLICLIAIFQNCGKQDFNKLDNAVDMSSFNDSTLVNDGSPEPSMGNDSEAINVDADADDNLRHYVCILEGNGASSRLGIIDEALATVGQTPQTICMSKNACESIVSQKFNVKFAAFRGYCKQSSSQIVILNDSDVAALITEE